MKKIINPAEGTITFKFEGDLPAIVFEAAKLTDANRSYAVLHGMSARIGDAAAITRAEAPGLKVTEAMRRAEVEALVNHYHSDSIEWSPRAKARTTAPLNPHINALAQARGLTYEQAMAWVAERAMAELMGGQPATGEATASEKGPGGESDGVSEEAATNEGS